MTTISICDVYISICYWNFTNKINLLKINAPVLYLVLYILNGGIWENSHLPILPFNFNRFPSYTRYVSFYAYYTFHIILFHLSTLLSSRWFYLLPPFYLAVCCDCHHFIFDVWYILVTYLILSIYNMLFRLLENTKDGEAWYEQCYIINTNRLPGDFFYFIIWNWIVHKILNLNLNPNLIPLFPMHRGQLFKILFLLLYTSSYKQDIYSSHPQFQILTL